MCFRKKHLTHYRNAWLAASCIAGAKISDEILPIKQNGRMSELQDFNVVGDHAEYRPSGLVSLKQAVDLVEAALALAKKLHIDKLLVVTTGLTGFSSPPLAERYFFIIQWARAAAPNARFAIVAHPEMIDRDKFGVTVAANNGLVSEIFASEDEALAWLQRGRQGSAT